MPQLLLSAVQSYLTDASLEDLTITMHHLYWRIQELERPQAKIEQFCRSRGWVLKWFPHPGIPGAVFLCIYYYKGKYREFVGYNSHLSTARNIAAGRALRYFKGLSRYGYHQRRHHDMREHACRMRARRYCR